MSNLVILAASVFEISCVKQTDTQMNGGINLTLWHSGRRW